MEIQLLENEQFQTNSSDMFYPEPRELVRYPINSLKKATWSVRSLLVKSGHQTILVDNGFGGKADQETIQKYGINRYNDKSQPQLSAINPDLIDHIFLTHLHLDHCGGSTYRDQDGNLHLQFRNAKYWCSRRQFEYAIKPDQSDLESYCPDDFLPLMESGRLFFIEDGFPFEAIEVAFYDGHTPGQAIFTFQGSGETFCFASDLLPSVEHLNPELGMVYDRLKEQALLEKLNFLESHANRENKIILLQHDFYHRAGRITKVGKNFIWQEIPLSPFQKILR